MGCGLSMDISDGRGSKEATCLKFRTWGTSRPSPGFPALWVRPSSITEYSSSVRRTSPRPAVRGQTPFPGLLLRWLALRVRAILPVSVRDFVGLESLCAVLSVALDIYRLT